jgi:hypothetical protein
MFSWVLRPVSERNMTVRAPFPAVAGVTGTVTLTFSGLTPGTKYLGLVDYRGFAAMPNPTVVRVDF